MNAQSWLTNRPIAHRGLHDNATTPENSLGAFELAISRSHPIEFDVRQTMDGRTVVFHDSSLFRMTGQDMNVAGCTWAEIKNLKLIGTQQTIPLFETVLELVGGRIPILIEIKNEGSVGQLEAAVADVLDRYSAVYAVQAFNPFSVRWFRKNRPDICRGQLSYDFRDRPDIGWPKKFILKNMFLNRLSCPNFVAYDIRAGDLAFFTRMKKRLGVPLLLWTIDSEEKVVMCRDLAVNYIFEGVSPA